MNETSIVLELAKDPITLVAVTIFIHTLSQFVRTMKAKPKAETSENSKQFTALNNTIREVAKVIAEIAKMVSAIALTQDSLDEAKESHMLELEKLAVLVRDLMDMHRDPDSKFSTVRVLQKEEEIIRLINDLKVLLAGIR